MSTHNRGDDRRMHTIEQRAAEFDRNYESREVAGWRYYIAGDGDTVLLLPGGAGIGISWIVRIYPDLAGRSADTFADLSYPKKLSHLSQAGHVAGRGPKTNLIGNYAVPTRNGVGEREEASEPADAERGI